MTAECSNFGDSEILMVFKHRKKVVVTSSKVAAQFPRGKSIGVFGGRIGGQVMVFHQKTYISIRLRKMNGFAFKVTIN